ncbi:Rv3235 family protein [Paractinoplanes deccanensis]|uniref:Rv3235 family protein n=1 Tax=Paractinoplanes deccanensis TaxID=113561 RepID=UPI001EF2CC15
MRQPIDLRPAPPCEPPFDDELGPAIWHTTHRYQLALDLPRPAPARPARGRPPERRHPEPSAGPSATAGRETAASHPPGGNPPATAAYQSGGVEGEGRTGEAGLVRAAGGAEGAGGQPAGAVRAGAAGAAEAAHTAGTAHTTGARQATGTAHTTGARQATGTAHTTSAGHAAGTAHTTDARQATGAGQAAGAGHAAGVGRPARGGRSAPVGERAWDVDSPPVGYPFWAAHLAASGRAPLSGVSRDATLAVKRFLYACVEVLNGYRPSAHLRRLSRPFEAAEVVSEGLLGAQRLNAVRKAALRAGRHPSRKPVPVAILSLHLCEPRSGVVEAAAPLLIGEHTWAMALRMEFYQQAWVATALRLIQHAYHPPRFPEALADH